MQLERYFQHMYVPIIIWSLQVIFFLKKKNSLITIMGERFEPWLAGSPNKGEYAMPLCYNVLDIIGSI